MKHSTPRAMLAPTAAAVVLLLAACGGGSESGPTTDNSGDRGSLVQNPPLRVTTLTAADLLASLNGSANGRSLLAVAGAPKCGVDFNYIQYGTVGAANEKTNASGALMVPIGTDPACSGARPVVLYGHGTTTAKGFNIANVLDSTNAAYNEALLVAATYAAQGYIVVAPNYAGYDDSRLPYHPYLIADQQSKDMIDALTAARKAFGRLRCRRIGPAVHHRLLGRWPRGHGHAPRVAGRRADRHRVGRPVGSVCTRRLRRCGAVRQRQPRRHHLHAAAADRLSSRPTATSTRTRPRSTPAPTSPASRRCCPRRCR